MSPESRKQLIKLSNVAPEPTRWVWQGHLPEGMLTLLEGNTGGGKSSVIYDLVARLTSGRPMPECSEPSLPAGAVLLSSEDLQSTIRRRIEAAGGDPSRVLICDKTHTWYLPEDLPAIEEGIAEVGAKLLVLDPLAAFMSGSLTSEHAIRSRLGPLAAWAERTRIAVLLVRHLTKTGSENPLFRGMGGVGVVSAARAVMVVGADPVCPARRVLAHLPKNLGMPPSLSFRIRTANGANTVEWLGESPLTANDVIGPGAESRDDPVAGRVRADQRRLAAWVLYETLERGPVLAPQVYLAAAEARVSKSTLDRAKVEMGVTSRRQLDCSETRWQWLLPAENDARLRPAIMSRLAEAGPGDHWTAPLRDAALHANVLAERGLTVASLGGREILIRAEDAGRVPLLEALSQASAAGDAVAAVAYGDLAAEMGFRQEPLG